MENAIKSLCFLNERCFLDIVTETNEPFLRCRYILALAAFCLFSAVSKMLIVTSFSRHILSWSWVAGVDLRFVCAILQAIALFILTFITVYNFWVCFTVQTCVWSGFKYVKNQCRFVIKFNTPCYTNFVFRRTTRKISPSCQARKVPGHHSAFSPEPSICGAGISWLRVATTLYTPMTAIPITSLTTFRRDRYIVLLKSLKNCIIAQCPFTPT